MLQPQVTSGKGTFGGVLPGWSVQEDATPIVVGDTSGGLGSVSFTAAKTDDSIFLAQKPITSVEVDATGATRLGFISGRVTSAQEKGATVRVSHDTTMSRLNVTRSVGPTGVWGAFVARRRLLDATGKKSTSVFVRALTTSVEGYALIYALSSLGDIQCFTRQGRPYGPRFGNYSETTDGPRGIAVDEARNVYVSLSKKNRIDKFSSAGTLLLSFGTTGSGNGQLNGPRQITWDSTNKLLWIADSNNNRAVAFDAAGNWVRNAGSVGTGTGQLSYPIAITTNGDIVYVGDKTKRIQAFTGSTGASNPAECFGGLGTDPGKFPSPDPEEFSLAMGWSTILVRDADGVHGFRMGSYAPFPTIPIPKGVNGQGSAITGNTYSLVTAGWDPSDPDSYGFRKYDIAASFETALEKYIAAADETIDISNSGYDFGLYDYTFPAWTGNVASQINDLCAAAGAQIFLFQDVICFRPTDQGTVNLSQYESQPQRTPSGRGTARKLQFTNQNVQYPLWPSQAYRNEVYPESGTWSPYGASSLLKVLGLQYSSSRSTGVDRARFWQFGWTGTETSPSGMMFTGANGNLQALKGRSYQYQVSIWSTKAQRMNIYIQWADGSKSLGGAIVVTPNVWTYIWVTAVAPVDGPLNLIATAEAGTGYSAWTAADTVWLGYMIFGESRGNWVTGFFDGGSKNCTWLGKPGASPSMWITYALPTAPAGTFVPEPTVYSAADDNNRVFSVQAGEVIEERLTTNVSLTFVESPTKSSDSPIGTSAYYITDGSYLPIMTTEWEAYGGKVEARIADDDPSVIVLTLTGPREDIPGVTGPYFLADSDGQNRYAQLNIRGFGVRTKPEVITLPTGADPATTPTEFGPVVNSPFHVSLKAIYRRVAWALADAAGPNVEIVLSVPITGLSFGVTIGSRIQYKDLVYRIRSITWGDTKAQLTCTKYVMVGEFKARWAGKTVGDVDAAWAGYSVGDANVAALR